MALPATIQKFYIDLSDVDRNVYEEIELRTAKHPSETEIYLVTRIIAYLLHYEDGAMMSKAGLSDPDTPPVLAQDLTGQMTHWIDLGLPSASRLHKATKSATHVFVYCHKDPSIHLATLARAQIYRAEDIQFYALSSTFLNEITQYLTRNNRWSMVRTEDEIFITTGLVTIQGCLTRYPIES